MRVRATIYDRNDPTYDGETVDEPELYATPDGSLAVLERGKGAYTVYHRHGIPDRPGAAAVPHSKSGGGEFKHPLAVGQEVPHSSSISDFRTKTAAKRYMLAVHESGILPTDRQATREDALALADWIRKAATE